MIGEVALPRFLHGLLTGVSASVLRTREDHQMSTADGFDQYGQVPHRELLCECPGVPQTLPVLVVNIDSPDDDAEDTHMFAHWTGSARQWCGLNDVDAVAADETQLLPTDERARKLTPPSPGPMPRSPRPPWCPRSRQPPFRSTVPS